MGVAIRTPGEGSIIPELGGYDGTGVGLGSDLDCRSSHLLVEL